MRLSTRGRYAVMALVELAARQQDRGEAGRVSLGEIAEAQALSLAYLEQLFGNLRRSGLVGGARGPGGPATKRLQSPRCERATHRSERANANAHTTRAARTAPTNRGRCQCSAGVEG